uniref:Polyphosphate kinase C-terminal domain-containing protein n=1 Tax=Conchiformibius kuhniae TaxID=211502 RepID=A0A8T9MY23_9NEIS|nr:hypothetical protein LVJ77_04080 [Conchiformibius kuhniae]
MKTLYQSPFTLHKRVLDGIDGEIAHAQAGKPAKIIAKMNSLVEPQVIQALYRASAAGVDIDLIVRGTCALRPQVAGLSENIRVRSIIGRLLEHSRVYYFLNGGKEDVLISSADWMGRNFFSRIETATPVRDPALKARVMGEGLHLALADNVKAWQMDGDGNYRRIAPADGEQAQGLQETLLREFGCL